MWMECEFKKSLLSHTGWIFVQQYIKSKPTGQITNKVKNSQQGQMSVVVLPVWLRRAVAWWKQAALAAESGRPGVSQDRPGLPFKDLTL